MKRSEDDPEDWIVRAKRGVLSPTEVREFRALLGKSMETRILYEAGCAFDRESSVAPGDDERIERIAQNLQKRFRRRNVAVPIRSFGVGVAAGMLLMAVVAGAVNLRRVLLQNPAHDPAMATSATGGGNAAQQARSVARGSAFETARTPEQPLMIKTGVGSGPFGGVGSSSPGPSGTLSHEANVLPGSSAGSSAGARRSARPPGARPSAVYRRDAAPKAVTAGAELETGKELAVPSPPASPSALFAQANQARVHGEGVLAIATYETLLSTFPKSREAPAARLSLGMLYLQSGRAEPALRQFRECGATSPTLAAEVLWGQAEALNALGRTEEERGILRRLVLNHPHSAYASGARARLLKGE